MKCIIEMDMKSAGKTDGAQLQKALTKALGVIENADLGPGTRFALRDDAGATIGKLTIRADRPAKADKAVPHGAGAGAASGKGKPNGAAAN